MASMRCSSTVMLGVPWYFARDSFGYGIQRRGRVGEKLSGLEEIGNLGPS
jgi:hypothetical protein